MVDNRRMKPRRAVLRDRLLTELGKRPNQRGVKADIARFCKVSPQAVGKWFKTGEVDLDNIPKLAAFFGRHPNWLLDDFVNRGTAEDIEPSKSKGDQLQAYIDALSPQSRASLLSFLKSCHLEHKHK